MCYFLFQITENDKYFYRNISSKCKVKCVNFTRLRNFTSFNMLINIPAILRLTSLYGSQSLSKFFLIFISSIRLNRLRPIQKSNQNRFSTTSGGDIAVRVAIARYPVLFSRSWPLVYYWQFFRIFQNLVLVIWNLTYVN